jgi:hypothetical protein
MFIDLMLHLVVTELYSRSFQSVIKAELIKAGSSTEDIDVRQRFFDSRTNTMINTPEVSPFLPQLKNVTFPSSPRSDNASVTLTRGVKYEPRKPNMTALSLDILRHTDKLRSLLDTVKDNEILEIVSLKLPFDLFFSF